MSWRAWGTVVRVEVTDPDALPSAHRLVLDCVAEAERAADVERRRAEIHRTVRSAGRPVRMSAALSALVAVALDVAERTDGAVDPTAGTTTVPLRLAARGRRPAALLPTCGTFPWVAPRPATGWRCIDWAERRLVVPRPAVLDLTATAKARTARLAAARVAERLGVGAAVELGGDVATAGPAPRQGWVVRPAHAQGAVLRLTAGEAAACCRAAGVVDPRTGRPVVTGWRSVVVTADDVVTAKAAAVATLVLGEAALSRIPGASGRTLFVPAGPDPAGPDPGRRPPCGRRPGEPGRRLRFPDREPQAG